VFWMRMVDMVLQITSYSIGTQSDMTTVCAGSGSGSGMFYIRRRPSLQPLDTA
jgi:hypothetical protein